MTAHKAHVQCSRCDSDQLIELPRPTDKPPKFECRNCGLKFYANIHGGIVGALAEAVAAAASPIPITPSTAWKCTTTGCDNPKSLNSSLCEHHAAAKKKKQQALLKKIKVASGSGGSGKKKSAQIVEAAQRVVIVPED